MTSEKKIENVGLDFTTTLNDSNSMSFSIPNNVNNIEAIPEVPDGECIREVASMAETATTASHDEGIVRGSSSTNSSSNSLTTDVDKKSFFRVPMGSRMEDSDNSSTSFRIVPPTDNNSNTGSVSDRSPGVQFRVPNTAEFQVPNSELDSSAIFQTNNSNKDDEEE
jgi:hypothetical protein